MISYFFLRLLILKRWEVESGLSSFSDYSDYSEHSEYSDYSDYSDFSEQTPLLFTLYPLLFFQCSAWCFGTDRPMKTAESIVKT